MSTPEERLDAALGALGSAPPDDALQKLAGAARAELAAQPRARAWWRDALGVLAVNLVTSVGAMLAMSRASTQHASMTLAYVVGLAWLALAAIGSAWWLRPGSSTRRWAVAGLFFFASALAMGDASGFDPGMPFFSGLKCALTECTVAVAPVALVVFLSLRFAARPSHLFAGALASVAGGALVLHLHCGNGTLAHLVVFHLLPGVVLAAMAVVVRAAMRPRAFVP